jgi:hypothetical protein
VNRRVAAFAVAAALAVGALAGCSSPPRAIEAPAAAAMQESVVAVADHAAAGDGAAALGALDELQRQLDEAVAAGSVSAQRAMEIQASIDLVRADLSTPVEAPAPEETTPAEPADDSGDDSGDDSDEGGDDSGEGGSGKGNSGNGGPGKDKPGKGKGGDD